MGRAQKQTKRQWEQHLYEIAQMYYCDLVPIDHLRRAWKDGDVAAAVIHETWKRRLRDDAPSRAGEE